MNPAGKTVLVTGSTDGLGREVALRLGKLGARVLVHGRDRTRGEEVVKAIKAGGGDARFYQADLASLAEVRRLAAEVLKDNPRLDILINNAGVGSGPAGAPREESADGHELRFAVNHLAGFLLTGLLLPTILKSAPARIVNVSSLGQQAIEFDDVMLTKAYERRRAYMQSKLAQILFTVDLAQALQGKGVTVTTLHPATYMDTKMVRAHTTPISTVAEGADAVMQLAVSDAVEGETGVYFNGLAEARAIPQAYDRDARARLMALSLKLTGLSDGTFRP
ncbi:MAG TPA: SDR family oxidoreductase [Xanthobacteraceae bacterium]|jgi:NAD(P)-dependent dehydrogenase (short-subunit alcohol dehydrogenase family)|nr:SDR family oxidoreductase [Xanthobacteraceae bacterium]